MIGLLLFLLLGHASVSAPSPHRFEILIVHSYSQEYPWTASQHNSFIEMLDSSFPDSHFHFSIEYLDTKWVSPGHLYQQTFIHYIVAKYRNHKPDLIYVTDDDALHFFLETRREEFWDVPIVFSGVNSLELSDSLDRSRFTGVFEAKGIFENVQLIRRIDPQTKKIVFIGDGGSTDQAILREIQNIKSRVSSIEVIHLSKPNLSEVLSDLAAIGPATLIVTTAGGFRDDQGNLYDLTEAIRQLGDTGRVVIVMEDLYVLPGALGGYVVSGEMQGEMAAKMAARILRGDAVSAISPVMRSPGEYVLDWNALQRFDLLSNRQVMRGATILNHPLPLIVRHPAIFRWIFTLLIGLIIVGALIFLYTYQKKERMIAEQSFDLLTGLYNRTRLIRDLRKYDFPLFAILDINNFQAINSFYGIEFGDTVLKRFASFLTEHLSSGVFLYRVDGDRFGLRVDNVIEAGQFEKFVVDLIERIKRAQLMINDVEIYLTVTVGINLSKHHSPISGAEHALLYAKENAIDFSTDLVAQEDASRQRENLFWVNRFGDALRTERIRPYFQPIIQNRTESRMKYEVLARLIETDGSIVMPSVFLESAKRTRKYAMFTQSMIEQSIDWLARRPYSLSLNFMVDDILNVSTISFLKKKVADCNFADRLIIEITESEGIERYEEVNRFIKEIREMGCRIAIDDFGTGYSNFEHLIRLNIDYLKFDGSLVRKVLVDKNIELLVQTLIEFAHRLGIETVMEFVESKEIFDRVSALGADYSQGYFIGEPVPELPEP